MSPEAREWIERLGLAPHPEGGHYREVYRAGMEVAHPGLGGTARSAATHVYFLLAGEDFSAFHQVRPSDEIWHLYAGGPVELHRIDADGVYGVTMLGRGEGDGDPVAVIEAGCWQAARLAPGSDWALCGCTVAPGFDFADFEMPGVEELVREFPEHEAVVRALTR